jgi:predicted dinucleotide-binding enzyme
MWPPAKQIRKRVLIDVTNPLDMSKGFPPSLFVCNTDSLGEQIQAAFPRLRVVKSLNTMACPVMIHPRSIPGNHTVFLSGNDADAKARVKILLMEFGWEEKNMMDLGDIVTARGPEMLVGMWVRVMDKIKNPFFNFHVNIAPQ